jgi:GINS complex subunit 2
MSSSSSASAAITTQALPSGLQLKSISAEESEFLAGETTIRITSNIDHSEFHFISGSFGPLQNGVPCDIPLWLALQLRRTGKCTIETPEWMTVARLEAAVAEEKVRDAFMPLPFHYIEIAQMLLTHARTDIESPDQVQVLLQDLEYIRMDRTKVGLQSIATTYRDATVPAVKLEHISSLEILAIKRFMTQSMGLFDRLIDNDSVDRGRDLGGYDGAPAPVADRTATRALRRFRGAN